MGIFSTVVLVGLAFVVVLAIAAASSASRSAYLNDEFSPHIKNPGNLVGTPSRTADMDGRLTGARLIGERSANSHPALTTVKTPPADGLAVPPVTLAAGLQ